MLRSYRWRSSTCNLLRFYWYSNREGYWSKSENETITHAARIALYHSYEFERIPIPTLSKHAVNGLATPTVSHTGENWFAYLHTPGTLFHPISHQQPIVAESKHRGKEAAHKTKSFYLERKESKKRPNRAMPNLIYRNRIKRMWSLYVCAMKKKT